MDLNVGFWICIVMVPFFVLVALIFWIGKEKATNLLAGFNALPEKERVLYDRARMAKDCARDYAIWAGIMLIGAMGSLVVSWYAAFLAYAVWLVLFFKDLHTDARKAFRKYLL